MDQPLKKILVFIDWYLPGFKAGGPIRSCASMVARLNSFFHFKIVTGNTDLNEPTPYPDVKSDTWNILEDGTDVFYCSKDFMSMNNIEKIINEEKPDVVYLNSMFSLYFTLFPLWIIRKNKLNVRVIVAPRGMLSKGALALKPLKKKIFLSVVKTFNLFKDVTFHASTEIEVREIKLVFGNSVKINHAINLSPKSEIKLTPRKKIKNKVNLVYVGRISSVKNLFQCLITLSKTSPENEFHLNIYGPHDDEAYLDLCRNEIDNLPSHVHATLNGPSPNEGIHKLMEENHFLFLLSMNENYGHAIVEAFTAGCPVIIGNRTPWKNLSEKQCGWDLPLEDPGRIVEVLNKAAAMDQSEYNSWSAAASEYAAKILENKKAIDDHLFLFNGTAVQNMVA